MSPVYEVREVHERDDNLTQLKSQAFDALYNTTGVLANIVVFIGSVAISGLVLVILWHWFVVPIVPVRQIDAAEAIGLGMLLKQATGTASIRRDDHSDTSDMWIKSLREVRRVVLTVTLVLAVGAFLHWLSTGNPF